VMGAITPVLHHLISICWHEEQGGTYNLLRAAEVPHAVPLILVPKVSGVIPSDMVLADPVVFDAKLT